MGKGTKVINNAISIFDKTKKKLEKGINLCKKEMDTILAQSTKKIESIVAKEQKLNQENKMLKLM